MEFPVHLGEVGTESRGKGSTGRKGGISMNKSFGVPLLLPREFVFLGRKGKERGNGEMWEREGGCLRGSG